MTPSSSTMAPSPTGSGMSRNGSPCSRSEPIPLYIGGSFYRKPVTSIVRSVDDNRYEPNANMYWYEDAAYWSDESLLHWIVALTGPQGGRSPGHGCGRTANLWRGMVALALRTAGEGESWHARQSGLLSRAGREFVFACDLTCPRVTTRVNRSNDPAGVGSSVIETCPVEKTLPPLSTFPSLPFVHGSGASLLVP